MRSILQKTIYALMVIGGIGLLVAGFIAYAVRSIDLQTGSVYDGFGRELTEVPVIARLVFTDESAWPGWAWFFGDVTFFWGSIGIGYLLFNLAEWLEKPTSNKPTIAS